MSILIFCLDLIGKKQTRNRPYCFSKSIVNSEGLSAFPHILHRPLVGLRISFIDFKFIILLITEPHFPQTISMDG
jgi:hypothetical protein